MTKRITPELVAGLRQQIRSLKLERARFREVLRTRAQAAVRDVKEARAARIQAENRANKLMDVYEELNDELKAAKADALEQLQDRAEVVGELLQRAAPVNWQFVTLNRRSADAHAQIFKSATITGSLEWRWSVRGPTPKKHSNANRSDVYAYGVTGSLEEAVALANKHFEKWIKK